MRPQLASAESLSSDAVEATGPRLFDRWHLHARTRQSLWMKARTRLNPLYPAGFAPNSSTAHVIFLRSTPVCDSCFRRTVHSDGRGYTGAIKLWTAGRHWTCFSWVAAASPW